MNKRVFGLIGALGALIVVAPAAHALPRSQAPAENTVNVGAALEPVQLVIAPHPDHNYHRDYYHRPVYHRDYRRDDHYNHHNHGPAIIIR